MALDKGYIQPGEILLTGPEAQVTEAAAAVGLPAEVQVVDAPDVLTSADSPTDALRKKRNNSIAVGIGLVKAGKAGGFVSAGSTGTVVAAATVGLRYLEGIRKNLSFLQRVLDGEHWELLRRRPPTSGNSSGPGEDDTHRLAVRRLRELLAANGEDDLS